MRKKGIITMKRGKGINKAERVGEEEKEEKDEGEEG